MLQSKRTSIAYDDDGELGYYVRSLTIVLEFEHGTFSLSG